MPNFGEASLYIYHFRTFAQMRCYTLLHWTLEVRQFYFRWQYTVITLCILVCAYECMCNNCIFFIPRFLCLCFRSCFVVLLNYEQFAVESKKHHKYEQLCWYVSLFLSFRIAWSAVLQMFHFWFKLNTLANTRCLWLEDKMERYLA